MGDPRVSEEKEKKGGRNKGVAVAAKLRKAPAVISNIG